MKLLSVNVELNLHHDRISKLFRDTQPDVMCMQEVLEDDVEFWKGITGYKCIYIPHMFLDRTEERYKEANKKRYGVAIFAQKFKNCGYQFYWGKEGYMKLSFEEFKLQSKEKESCVYVYADVIIDDKEYRICTTHFFVTEKGYSTPPQLKLVDTFLEHVKDLGEVIICGDFNAPRGNKTFARISAKYKDCIPSHYKTSIDASLHRDGEIIHMVDGLFLSPSYEASNVELISGVSDHMAIFATITKK